MARGREASGAAGDSASSGFRLGLIARIEDRLQARGVNRSSLARSVRVAPDAVTLWLDPDPPAKNKNRMPTLEQLRKMAEVLDTSCDYLVGISPDPSPPTAEKLQLPRAHVERALEYVNDAADALREAMKRPGSTSRQAPRSGDIQQGSSRPRSGAERLKKGELADGTESPEANEGTR